MKLMNNQPSNRKNVRNNAGIIASGDVSFGDVSGQLAIGKYINQFKVGKLSGEALVKLMDCLDKKRNESFNKEKLHEIHFKPVRR